MARGKLAHNHAVAFMFMLVMLFSFVSGMVPGDTGVLPGGVTPVLAAGAGSSASSSGGTGTVDNLWDQVGNSGGGTGTGLYGQPTNLDTVVTKAQSIAKTITSILTVISFVSLLFWIARLALSAGNPRNRTTALTGILFSGIALALFGGAWIVVSFFWNLLSA